MPGNFQINKVQQEMQQAVNNAKLPLFINLLSMKAAKNGTLVAPSTLGKSTVPLNGVAFQWNQSVIFTEPLVIFGKRRIAYTPNRTKTQIDPTYGFLLAKDAGIKADRFYSNVLLHEVFWLGVLNETDDLRVGTQLSSGNAARPMMTFTKDERDNISDAIGPQ